MANVEEVREKAPESRAQTDTVKRPPTAAETEARLKT